MSDINDWTSIPVIGPHYIRVCLEADGSAIPLRDIAHHLARSWDATVHVVLMAKDECGDYREVTLDDLRGHP